MIEQLPTNGFALTRQPWGRALQWPRFGRVASHLFTTRDLPLCGAGSDGGWAQLAASTGVARDRLARLKQVHGAAVVVIKAPGRPLAGDDRPQADIVMTDDPSFAVSVQVADCVPLLLADPVTGAVAAVHGGWRGTAAGVARVAVAAMRAHFGALPTDLLAAIGPSIGVCCYQVGPDVRAAFRAGGFPDETLGAWFRPDEPGHHRFDLPKAIADQLQGAGLSPGNIAACGLCTACHPTLFPSYRRDGAHTGRIAAAARPAGAR